MNERRSQKSTGRAQGAKKAPTGHCKKTPTGHAEKALPYYSTSGVFGVVSDVELKELLKAEQQDEWCTRIRICGLLLLIDYLLRQNAPKGHPISASLAHDYISKLGRRNSTRTIPEPLAVLCHVGIFRLVRPAVNGWHVKTPAIYAIAERYRNRHIELDVRLTACLSRKRECAFERREQRLNERYPFRAQLLTDLAKLGFGIEARRLIVELSHDPNLAPSTQRTVAAIDAGKHQVRISPRGQFTTSISSCPKRLKPRLLLGGEPTISCDISHAHHCFLPCLLAERIEYLRREHGAHAETCGLDTERTRLISFLSEGDYYRKWCVHPEDNAEREEKKDLLNMLLNWPNPKCEANRLYLRMRRAFPLTFRIIEDIKRPSHQNISKPLQHFTAKAINAALLEAQMQAIPAIPDVDAIICPQRHRTTVCELIGRKVHEITGGVCCKVDDVRFEPDQPTQCAPVSAKPSAPAAPANCDIIVTACRLFNYESLAVLAPGGRLLFSGRRGAPESEWYLAGG